MTTWLFYVEREKAMKRQTVVLDGTWSVVFDDKNIGKQKKFFESFPKGKAIDVPGVWEQVRPGYDGVGWYRRTFEAVAAWKTRCVRLQFGAVNYFCEVYLNGRRIGQHEGGYTAFEFDISGKFKVGTNELVVRVIDPPRRKTIEGYRSGAPLSHSDTPAWKAGWYWNFGGIWQSVKLVVCDPVYVEDVFVEPLPDKRTAKVHVTVRTKKAATVDLAVDVAGSKGAGDTGGKASRRVSLKRGSKTVALPVKIRNMKWWDTENPFLYTATVALSGGGFADETSVRFGMRTFTVKDGHFCLNGKRIALKGVLQQGAYPRTLAFADTPALLRKELELVKSSGMNFIRLHLKPDPFTPELADEMGVLLCAEPPAGWIANGPHTMKRCLRESEELVRRDRNHPSIVMWCMLNEIYHYWTFTNKEMDRLRYAMSLKACELDPTRIVGDNSGGAHEYEDCAGALMPYKKTYSPLRDLHQYCSSPLTDEALTDRYRNIPKAGGPIYISEFGAYECPPDFDRTLARYSAADKRKGLEDYAQYKSYWDSLKQKFNESGARKIFGDVKEFVRQNDLRVCEEVRAVVSAMRSNPHMDAYAICQIADASGEIFGITDIWRQPKLHFADYAAAAQTPLVVPHFKTRLLEPGQTVDFDLRCVNEHTTGNKYTVTVTFKPEKGGLAFHTLSKSFTAKGWVQDVLTARFPAPSKGGRYVAEAVLKEGSKVRCTNSLRFTVVEQPPLENPLVRLLGGDPRLLKALNRIGAVQDRFTNSSASKNVPFILVGHRIQDGGPSYEHIKQVSRQVRLGGVAILIEPANPIFYDDLLPKVIRNICPMRSIGYVFEHPIVEGLPSNCIVEYEYGRLLRGIRNCPEDVRKAGGRTIMGGIGAHMWTKPDEYIWNGLIDEVPVGRGKVLLVQMTLLDHVDKDPVARRLLRNLIAYAYASIKPGLDECSPGRPMDPITAP
ncbi:MAG: hypothetical protein JXL80_06870 [Planctomycetes bacterium]|nr:hypothetical protein [Planctomycetota bacterium]